MLQAPWVSPWPWWAGQALAGTVRLRIVGVARRDMANGDLLLAFALSCTLPFVIRPRSGRNLQRRAIVTNRHLGHVTCTLRVSMSLVGRPSRRRNRDRLRIARISWWDVANGNILLRTISLNAAMRLIPWPRGGRDINVLTIVANRHGCHVAGFAHVAMGLVRRPLTHRNRHRLRMARIRWRDMANGDVLYGAWALGCTTALVKRP